MCSLYIVWLWVITLFVIAGAVGPSMASLQNIKVSMLNITNMYQDFLHYQLSTATHCISKLDCFWNVVYVLLVFSDNGRTPVTY